MITRSKQKKTKPQLDPERQYEIQALLGKKCRKGKNEYLVKWENSWEVDEGNHKDLIDWARDFTYNVKALLGNRLCGREIERLVKWENSWVPEENIPRDLVEDFEIARKRAHNKLQKRGDPKSTRRSRRIQPGRGKSLKASSKSDSRRAT